MGIQQFLGLCSRRNSRAAFGDRYHPGINRKAGLTANCEIKESYNMKTLTKTIILAVLLGLGLTTFSGCRTAHGFGEDMEKAGEKIQSGTN